MPSDEGLQLAGRGLKDAGIFGGQRPSCLGCTTQGQQAQHCQGAAAISEWHGGASNLNLIGGQWTTVSHQPHVGRGHHLLDVHQDQHALGVTVLDGSQTGDVGSLDRAVEFRCGLDLAWGQFPARRWTESTTMPTVRWATLRMMTTVKLSYFTSGRPKRRRISTMGTMTPRRLTTPLMKWGRVWRCASVIRSRGSPAPSGCRCRTPRGPA